MTAMTAPDGDLLNNLPLEVRTDRPLYAQLVDALRVLVEAHFRDGDLFYSEKTLRERLPVSQITIRRALRELTTEGLLVPGRGRGTIIRKKMRAPGGAVHSSPGATRQTNRSGHTIKRILGIFLPQPLLMLSEHARELMQEFLRQGDLRDIEVQFHYASDTARLSQIFRSVSGNRDEIAFVLHTPSDLTYLLYHALDNRGYISVAMEGFGPDYPGQVVATDAMAAIQIGMDYLHDLGHQNIVLLVNEPVSEFNVQDKIYAFEKYIQEKGLEASCRVVVCDQFAVDGSYEAAYEHMNITVNGQPPKPTAIFTASDPGAWAALKWCYRHGLRVPEDISILGFENARLSQYMYPEISSVAHPNTQLVEATFDILWGEQGLQVQKRLITPHLVIRDSVGLAPARAEASL